MFLPYLFQGSFIINVAAALIPAIFLMRYIYKKDSIEKEPRKLLVQLVLLGVCSAFIAMVLEGVLGRLLNATMLDPAGALYNILMAFIVVAVSEEGAKYFLTHVRTWKDPAFNYKFDAVVYCVFTSLGFAAFENVLYVLQGGLSVAIARAFLSIPGHMSFAVIMGVFYGRAKQCQHRGDIQGMKKNKLLAFVWAVAAHGFYDACLMVGTGLSVILFVAFVICMYIFIFRLIKNEADTDVPVVDQPIPLDQLAASLPNQPGQGIPGWMPYGQQGVNPQMPQGVNPQMPQGQTTDVTRGPQGWAPNPQGQIYTPPQAPQGWAPQGQNYVPPQGQNYIPPQGSNFVQPQGLNPQTPLNPQATQGSQTTQSQNPFAPQGWNTQPAEEQDWNPTYDRSDSQQ